MSLKKGRLVRNGNERISSDQGTHKQSYLMKEPNVKKVLVEVTIADGLEIEARQTSKL